MIVGRGQLLRFLDYRDINDHLNVMVHSPSVI